MTTAFAYCNVPVMPVRSEPFHRAEQISQVLFGEKVHIISPENKGWVYITCEWDHYSGWVKASQLTFIDKKSYTRKAKFINTSAQDYLQHDFGKTPLALGSNLYQYKKRAVEINATQKAIFKGKKINISQIQPSEELCKQMAFAYLGAGYVWGGRSSLGLDCSGFSQMVYKLMNIRIKRDAYQQAEQGEIVDFLQAAQCGDLAFFDNEEGRINHVGILLNDHTIIHATESAGCVVVDKIDTIGIISTTLKQRTHNLRIIKRFF